MLKADINQLIAFIKEKQLLRMEVIYDYSQHSAKDGNSFRRTW